MATFQSWLNDQLVRPENDPIGWLARQWKGHEGNRPRVSSPTAIGRFLEDQAGENTELRGYVNQAVVDATTAYRDRDSAEPVVYRDGSPANEAAEQAAVNPATGKPVAVVSSTQWVTHPNAQQFGSCSVCGWPRGLVGDVGGRTVITCAAGHIFEPEKPEPLTAAGGAPADPGGTAGGQTTFSYGDGALDPRGYSGGPADTPEPPATAGGQTTAGAPPAEISYDPSADAPDSVQLAPGAHSAVIGGPEFPDTTDQFGDRDDGLEQVLVMQGMILHTLTRIARHIGLPPEQLDVAVDSAVEMVEMAHGSPQMPVQPFGAPPFPPPPAGAPGDLSSQLYGLAGQSAAGHQPGNDPQAFASWFNAAEYGDPGNGPQG